MEDLSKPRYGDEVFYDDRFRQVQGNPVCEEGECYRVDLEGVSGKVRYYPDGGVPGHRDRTSETMRRQVENDILEGAERAGRLDRIAESLSAPGTGKDRTVAAE